MTDAERFGVVAGLLARAGRSGEPRLVELEAGGNNRGYLLQIDGERLFVKEYFRHPDDPRDRFGTEYAFVRFAWAQGVRCLPRPLAADDAAGVALYEFVAGRKLRPDQVDAGAVAQALAFYQALNARRRSPEAAALPLASESCFSIAQHLELVDRRVARLAQLGAEDALSRDAQQFAVEQLARGWASTRQRICVDCGESDLALDAELPGGARRLSPSDFGFHNALCGEDGALRFIDFEYAGWDDPAKLVCDFFCQPEVPVPIAHYPDFADAVSAELPHPAVHRRRMDLLLDAYRTKWCCIMLNVFLPVGTKRRQFASAVAGNPEHRAAQLTKARGALAQIRP